MPRTRLERMVHMCKKKAVYTVGELSMQMQNMYNKLNVHCFNGILPRAVITFEQGKKQHAKGWTYSKKMWKQGKEYKYAIVIAIEYLDDLEGVLITLAHEMCHLYAMEKGIKDTSRKGYYHNDNFKLIAEMAGLVCTKEPQGWATRTATENLHKWFEENCPISEIRLRWGGKPIQQTEAPKPEETGSEGESGAEEQKPKQKPKKKSGYYVYKCPQCGATIRATKANLAIFCAGTVEQLHEVALVEIEN